MARKEIDRAEANLSGENKYYVDIIAGSLERTIKRLWIVVIILICLFVATNAGWIYYESQFVTVESQEIIQRNTDGINNYIGNDGDIYNGNTDHPNN